MLLKKENYFDTGGNCMVMYVDVLNGGEIKQIAVTDEIVAGFAGRVEDGFDEMENWSTEDYEQLVQLVGTGISSQLHQTFLKYSSDALWFPEILEEDVNNV